LLSTFLAFLLLGVAGIVMLSPSRVETIASRGGEARLMRAITTPHYVQTDPRWGSDRLGPTIESLAASGCTVCCVSMALAHYGVDIPPGELNRRLAASSGFTRIGWLKWTSVASLTHGRIVADVPRSPDYDDLDDAIANGWPVVTEIRLRGEVPHWVLVVGKNGLEYLARDPLVPGRLVALSQRSAIIEAVRIIRPA
jgi:hypothetical protein